MIDRHALRSDYARWHRAQIATGDIDPAYPVLRQLCGQLGRDEGAWLVLRHVAFYHLGSALRSYAESPGARLIPATMTLPTGTERRGHRDLRQFALHWADLVGHVTRYGGPRAFLTPTHTGRHGWNELIDRLCAVRGNGRWAAYKSAELAQKVLDVLIIAPDAGHAYSSGPRKGLALLEQIPDGNRPEDIAVLDEMTTRLAHRLGEPDIAQVETSLCDFHSAFRGRYYIGKDIDEQLHHLEAVRSDFTPAAFAIRQQVFPAAYLGELHGWSGVDRERQRVYARTGRIILRESSCAS